MQHEKDKLQTVFYSLSGMTEIILELRFDSYFTELNKGLVHNYTMKKPLSPIYKSANHVIPQSALRHWECPKYIK